MVDKHLGRPPVDPAIRFWKFVQKTNGCWLWTGAKNARGYGYFWFGQGINIHKAAHASWFLAFGYRVPTGLDLCHRCDNPSCVNPEHLFIGTRSDNVQDALLKNRRRQPPYAPPKNGPAGRPPMVVDVGLAKKMRSDGKTISVISRTLNVSRMTVRRRLHG